MLAMSTKYALKALLHLAKVGEGEFAQVKALSESAGVPGPYLSKIMKQLAAKGIVESRRGAAGGVRLPRGRGITFLDVCVALEDPVLSSGCFLGRKACSSKHPCVMHGHWSRMKGEMSRFLRQSKIN